MKNRKSEDEENFSLVGDADTPRSTNFNVRKRDYKKVRFEQTKAFNRVAIVLLIMTCFVLSINFLIVFDFSQGIPMFRNNLNLSSNSNQKVIYFTNIALRANFDQGNLFDAEEESAFSLEFWAGGDKTSFSKELKANVTRQDASEWFYFQVKKLHQPVKLTFWMKNLKWSRLVEENGIQPVFKRKNSEVWEPLRRRSKVKRLGNGNIELYFEYHYNPVHGFDVEIALQRPWGVEKNIDFYQKLENEITSKRPDLYYRSEQVAISKRMRPVMVNWITQKSEMPKIGKSKILGKSKIPKNDNSSELYTLDSIKANLQMLKSTQKRFVVLLGRSFGFDSISSEFFAKIQQIFLKKNKNSKDLLSNYVFITVPMMNPDGVHHGYSRFDSSGNNQMDFFKNAKKSKSPEIAKIRDFLKDLASTGLLKAAISIESELGLKDMRMEIPQITQNNKLALGSIPFAFFKGKKMKNFKIRSSPFLKQISTYGDSIAIARIYMPSISSQTRKSTPITENEILKISKNFLKNLKISLDLLEDPKHNKKSIISLFHS